MVGTQIDGLNEAVIQNGTATLVPPDDPEALAGALKEMMENGKLRRAYGKAGREWAARYTWDVIGNLQLNYYKKVIRGC